VPSSLARRGVRVLILEDNAIPGEYHREHRRDIRISY
jgi:hypothetical protein